MNDIRISLARRTILLCALCSMATTILVDAQQGHLVRGNSVRVERASHWRAWQGAASLVDISNQGVITPVLVRKEINAALDASAFAVTTSNADTPGGVSVGSNPGQARFMVDGDPATSWGPDPTSPLGDWWLELNLGRIVVVKKIIIRFAEEDAGDPFLQFKVLGWRQPPPRSTTKYLLAGTDIPRFWEIGRTIRPNKTERVFEFVPRTTEVADDVFFGDPLDRIQIIATGSDNLRGEQVTLEQYEALPSMQQGAIEYFRRELSGRETLVSETEYTSISEDRKGPIHYFRREIPRIAEIEVITEGDNVNLGLVERGGTALIQTQSGGFKAIPTAADGTYFTGHNGSIFPEESFEYLQDLGALFWMDTMHFLLDGSSTIDEWVTDVSDGTRAPDGSISYTPVGDRGARVLTRAGLRFRAVTFEPRKVRYLRSTLRTLSRTFYGITEILLYGQGFVPEVELTSDLILFDETKNLISIDWDGESPAGTSIQVQTRTGNELVEENIYYDSKGNEVTESRYNRLPSSRKGDIETRFLPGADWSTWSVPYVVTGSQISSPSPRQFMQLRATLTTDRADVAASLSSIVVNMSDPVAESLVSEVWPLRIDHVGEEEEFSLYLRPEFSSSAQGFDEIRVVSTAGTRMELLSAHFGSDSDFENDSTNDLALTELEIPSVAPDSLHFKMPASVRRGTDLVEIRFRATVLGNSGSFRSFVRDSGEGIWQRVDEGDATDLVASQSVTVLALEGSQVLSNISVSSSVITPNADGVNDEFELSFSVARVSGGQTVTLSVYDLSGRLVRQLDEQRADARGQYVMRWDGTNSAAALVAPGTYLVRIDVDVDSRSANNTSRTQGVYVAY
jgi:hypothetical protein